VIADLLASLRPAQWTKNLLVFAGLIFSQGFLHPVLIGRGLWWPVPMMILLRTLLLIVLLIELTKRCRPIEAGREAARHSVHA